MSRRWRSSEFDCGLNFTPPTLPHSFALIGLLLHLLQQPTITTNYNKELMGVIRLPWDLWHLPSVGGPS